jgi:uncharacterized repeat protein (TIGR01451 family)
MIFSFLLGMTAGSVPVAEAATWEEKVDPLILSTALNGDTEFLVFLKEQADLSGAAILGDKTAKGNYVYEALTSLAETSQKPIRASLDNLGVPYQPFWIANMLWVQGDIRIVEKIAQRPDVAHIYANPPVHFSQPEPNPFATVNVLDAIEWNIAKINADDVWAEGFTGQGVVIGGQDTGYEWDHPALINQYRGWNGKSVSHDYNWYDATGLSPNTPVDPHSHGTHTMGTMVGDDGGSNQVGVAPRAAWIGCRNMNSAGYGTPTTYMACYQWFVAPTRTDGSDPRPDLAPDVINNSWSCPAYEGCTEPDMLLAVVQAVRAAGILTAHSAGNDGPGCGTINEPATIYSESFSVGSTTNSDVISSFSSRGPVTVDGSDRFKPQVSAPGSFIRSSIPGDDYGIKSGTSMAAPHVAGLTALMISAQPVLSGQVDELENLIQKSAVPLFTSDGCGGDTSGSHPNHTYGWGLIDAWNAYQELPHGLLVKKIVPEVILPGGILTFTLTVTNSHPFSDTYNVILTDTIPGQTSFITATGNYALNGELVSWDIGDLTAKTSESVALVVQVPFTATGTISNTMYGAVSDQVSTAAKGDLVSTVVYQPDATLQPTGDVWANPKDQVAYQRYLTNLGNYTDTFQVDISSSLGWTISSSEAITLGINKTYTITLIVNVPLDAQSGQNDAALIDVSSQLDPDYQISQVINTRVYLRQHLPITFKRP